VGKKRKLAGPTFAESKKVIIFTAILLLLTLSFTFYMAFVFEYPSGVLARPALGHTRLPTEETGTVNGRTRIRQKPRLTH
jgi:hypothetical protein